MGVYDNRARRSREDDLELIIKDSPTTVTRTRKAHTDQTRAATTATAGPFTCRIERFRVTRNATAFDEKGSGTTTAYVLVLLNRPANGATWTIPSATSGVPTFQLDDILTDAAGYKFRVTTPARWEGNTLELNIELLG